MPKKTSQNSCLFRVMHASERSIKLDLVRLGSEIERSLNLTQIFWFDCARSLNSIELNRSIKFDYQTVRVVSSAFNS